ncbi:hypothetical protein D9M70_425460 [compost metagenome]
MEQHFEGQHPVLAVEEEAGELLMVGMAQLCLEIIAHRLRALHRGVAAQPFGQVTPGHFQHRLQLGEFGRTEAKMLAEVLQLGLEQGAQAAEVVEQMAGEVDGAAASHPGTQENGKEFGVGKGRRTQFEKLLPRTFRRRPIADAHDTSMVEPRRCSSAVAVIS